jgi:hypothetical protein
MNRVMLVGTLLVSLGLRAKTAHGEDLRDPWLWPFAATSIWNTPVGADARYVPAGLGKAKYVALDDELLYKVPADAPKRTLFAPKGWETRAGGTLNLGEIRVPDDLLVPDAKKGWTPNFCAAFLQPDGRTVVNVAPLCRVEKGGPVYGYRFDNTDLWGDGIHGSHGASRMSALGGSIRKGELTGKDPIRHALKVDIYCKPYCYFGDDRKGFRWPAAGADGYASKESYAGKNKAVVMGSLLAIPPDQTPEKLGLKTAVGKKLFSALQDYGAYVVDDSAWDAHYLCAEQGVKEEVKKETGLDVEGDRGDLFDDVNALFVALSVIDNNDPKAVGGGGKRRAAAPPPLPPGPKAARAVPAMQNGAMSDGKDTPDHWTNKWEGEGTLKVSRDEKTVKQGPAALKVESVGGKAKGQISQIVDAAPGDVVRFAGYVKTSGRLIATVGVMTYTKDWQGIEFQAIQQTKTDQDWLPFAGEVTLPKGTARCAFAVMVDGDGAAWLDECTSDERAFKSIADEAKNAIPASSAPKAPAAPKAENAWSPGEGYFPDYPDAWKSIHAGFVEQAKKGEAEVVFLGDSISRDGVGARSYGEPLRRRRATNLWVIAPPSPVPGTSASRFRATAVRVSVPKTTAGPAARRTGRAGPAYTGASTAWWCPTCFGRASPRRRHRAIQGWWRLASWPSSVHRRT